MNIPAFDKTGTLTQGLPIVQKIYSRRDGFDAGAHDCRVWSSSPNIHQLIVAEAKNQQLDLGTPPDSAAPGKGVWAKFGQQLYLVGNRRLFTDHAISCQQTSNLLATVESNGQTPVLVGKDRVLNRGSGRWTALGSG